MHLETNYEKILDYGFDGVALSYMYIHSLEEINNLRKKISKKWLVRK